jgi:DNA ligase-1
MSFDIQKAIDYRDLSTKVQQRLASDLHNYVVQPKYDGCHARFVFEGGECVTVLSSLGNEVKSCQHIADQLWGLVADGTIHGEVWHPGLPFQDVSGMFRRQYPAPELGFVAFDYTDGLQEDPSPYHERMRRLRGLSATATGPGQPIHVEHHQGYSPIDALFDAAVAKQQSGRFDGLILRHMDKPYKAGRCRDGEVIKIKPLVSLDLKVVEVFPERGEKTGKNTCALGLQWAKGTVQRVATGLKQAQVDAFVAAPSQIVGKIVEVEAMGYTSDGFLREPRFVRIRDDKDTPDV